jgi:hypothetical protein
MLRFGLVKSSYRKNKASSNNKTSFILPTSSHHIFFSFNFQDIRSAVPSAACPTGVHVHRVHIAAAIAAAVAIAGHGASFQLELAHDAVPVPEAEEAMPTARGVEMRSHGLEGKRKIKFRQ